MTTHFSPSPGGPVGVAGPLNPDLTPATMRGASPSGGASCGGGIRLVAFVASDGRRYAAAYTDRRLAPWEDVEMLSDFLEEFRTRWASR